MAAADVAQSMVEADQALVPLEAGGQGGVVEGASDAEAAASDVTLPTLLACIIVERCQPCQTCCLLA